VQELLKEYGPMIGFALLCVMMLRQYVDLGAIFGGLRTAVARVTPAAGAVPVDIDQDTREHQAAMLLAARADRRKCPECKEAIKAYQTHWLDDNSRTEG
jgi:hypothetical protein